MRSSAADSTFDDWMHLPADDHRTIEEFAEQSSEPKPIARGPLKLVSEFASPRTYETLHKTPLTDRLRACGVPFFEDATVVDGEFVLERKV